MLEVMYQDVNFPESTVGDEEMSMLAVEVRQGIPFFGKRGARRDAARAVADLRAREIARAERRITAEVRRIYAQLYSIDRERQALEAGGELLDMLAATVAARYSAGEAELEAQVKAQLEVSRLHERSSDLDAERAAAVAALNRLLDRPTDASVGTVPALPAVQPRGEPWETLALVHAPDLDVGTAAVAAAAQRLREAQKERPPDWFVGIGYSYRGDLDHLATLRVGVELPFWRGKRTGPRVQAAAAELDEARQELRDAQAMARAEVARLTAAWNRSEAQVQRYREAILPQSSTALDAARASYLAGRGDFSTVVEDFEMWLESNVQLASREAERFTTWAELELLLAPAAPAEEPR
jgi:outer membrane protein TolC